MVAVPITIAQVTIPVAIVRVAVVVTMVGVVVGIALVTVAIASAVVITIVVVAVAIARDVIIIALTIVDADALLRVVVARAAELTERDEYTYSQRSPNFHSLPPTAHSAGTGAECDARDANADAGPHGSPAFSRYERAQAKITHGAGLNRPCKSPPFPGGKLRSQSIRRI
jgi:hypothetical protein